MVRVGALAGKAAELFTPGEYDTATAPVVILTVILFLPVNISDHDMTDVQYALQEKGKLA